jgi:hypothetical protein
MTYFCLAKSTLNTTRIFHSILGWVAKRGGEDARKPQSSAPMTTSEFTVNDSANARGGAVIAQLYWPG